MRTIHTDARRKMEQAPFKKQAIQVIGVILKDDDAAAHKKSGGLILDDVGAVRDLP